MEVVRKEFQKELEVFKGELDEALREDLQKILKFKKSLEELQKIPRLKKSLEILLGSWTRLRDSGRVPHRDLLL